MSTYKIGNSKLSDLEILFKRAKLARELAEQIIEKDRSHPSIRRTMGWQGLLTKARQLLKLYG